MRGFYLLLCFFMLMLSVAVGAVTFYVPVTVTVNAPGGLEGDVNGDCIVNIFDLALVGLAYGSQPGDFNWNPDADIYPPGGDGKIDIFDLATVGLNYGNTC